MPNHVTNRVIVTGPPARVEAFLEKHIGKAREDETHLDFETIVPMPEFLSSFDADPKSKEAGAAAALGLLDRHSTQNVIRYVAKERPEISSREKLLDLMRAEAPEAIERIVEFHLARIASGLSDWYSWRIDKWGTKWNSYSFNADVEPGRAEMTFDTAWSFPLPIMQRLAETWPDLTFDCACFDEGHGFSGSGKFNGEPPFEIRNADPDDYEAVHGHPIEEDEDED
jgi:hypothetical protein